MYDDYMAYLSWVSGFILFFLFPLKLARFPIHPTSPPPFFYGPLC
jgi:hypothetical protein